jgi:hypothetical protein
MSDNAATQHYKKFISNAIGFMEKNSSSEQFVAEWKKNTPEEKLKDKYLEFKKIENEKKFEEQLKDLFELFQKVPGWEKFPMPENFYKYFNVKKPKPDDNPVVQSKEMFWGGEKTEIEYRNAEPGGIREVILPEPLKTETHFIPDEPINEIASDKPQDLLEDSSTRPRADSSSESQHE